MANPDPAPRARAEQIAARASSGKYAESQIAYDIEAAITEAVQQVERRCDEQQQMIDWIADAAGGQPLSDFALSFPHVRAVADLAQGTLHYGQALDQCADELQAVLTPARRASEEESR